MLRFELTWVTRMFSFQGKLHIFTSNVLHSIFYLNKYKITSCAAQIFPQYNVPYVLI